MLTISSVDAFSDNYIWVLQRQNNAIAVDPGDAAPLIAFLDAHQLNLQAVLLTHWHQDHTGGIEALRQYSPGLRIFGPATLKQVSNPVQDGDSIKLLDLSFSVMAVPGHTLDHLAYHAAPWLFCGDTLFAAGCGRLFEGSAAQMHASLSRLAALPPDTQIYPAHEYTLSNLAFAQAVEPFNDDIKKRFVTDSAKRSKGQPTLPSTLAQEQATNPFLRVENDNVRSAVTAHTGKEICGNSEIFAALRSWKDAFRNVID
jgi:hydroxyacylglutathione hydrolase